MFLPFEQWPICEFVRYNDKRCTIISAADIIGRYLSFWNNGNSIGFKKWYRSLSTSYHHKHCYFE